LADLDTENLMSTSMMLLKIWLSECNFFQKSIMKTRLLFLFLLSFSAMTTNAQFSAYLLELESNTKWDAVEENWSGIRDQWVANCKMDNTEKVNGLMLVQFESNLKWTAVEELWKKRRDAWIKDCASVSSHAQLAKLLIELEENIKWTSVETSWKQRRTGWINELKKLK
jgi:hypothetical protein